MKKTRHKIIEWGYNATDIPALFRQFDVDSSGELDLEEFRQMITEMSIGLTDARICELFESIDADGSGSIDHKEFIKCLFPGLYHRLCAQEFAAARTGSVSSMDQVTSHFSRWSRNLNW